MRMDLEAIRAFFKRTGKVECHSWDENVLKEPKIRTVEPDERLSFNETFKNINKQLTK